MKIIRRGKYYEGESIIRRKVLWEGKDYQKKVSPEGKYYEKESILRKSKLCEGNYYETENIIEKQLF